MNTFKNLKIIYDDLFECIIVMLFSWWNYSKYERNTGDIKIMKYDKDEYNRQEIIED